MNGKDQIAEYQIQLEKYEENPAEKPIRDAGNHHEENILKMFCDITSRENSSSDAANAQQLSPNEIEKEKDIAENNQTDLHGSHTKIPTKSIGRKDSPSE